MVFICHGLPVAVGDNREEKTLKRMDSACKQLYERLERYIPIDLKTGEREIYLSKIYFP